MNAGMTIPMPRRKKAPAMVHVWAATEAVDFVAASVAVPYDPRRGVLTWIPIHPP